MKANNIALKGSLNDTEKSLDRVTLSLDRSESQVKRLSQQNLELQDTENVKQDELSKVVLWWQVAQWTILFSAGREGLRPEPHTPA